jgi:hypothetical protein
MIVRTSTALVILVVATNLVAKELDKRELCQTFDRTLWV